jgi:anti-sigma factor RsiW
MCNFSGRLIAWLDGELPEAEAIHVEWHVRQCAECRRAAAAYREISGAFLDGYLAAMPVQSAPRRSRWIAVAGAAAAAIVLAAVLTHPRPGKLRRVPFSIPAPAMAFQKTRPRLVAVRARHTPVPSLLRRPARERWVAVQPSVEIALPADALFPPGAVPAGFSFIADVRPQP